MPRYFAIFGKTPALSAAEIWASLRRDGLEAKTTRLATAGMIFETASELDPGFWDSLGGTVKAGTVTDDISTSDSLDSIVSTIAHELDKAIPEGKIAFGINSYQIGKAPDQAIARLARLGAATKSALVESGRSARHVTSKDKTLSAVTVKMNRLLDKGREYCLFVDPMQTALGVTTWVQDYEAFAGREFKRPRSDALSGMVPVKLARMLLNLAGITKETVLLDPFCGSGTIVAEALVLGCGKAIGSDISEKAVRETAENIEWIKGITSSQAETTTLVSAIGDLPGMIDMVKVDAIVTEPYLGPPLRGRESKETLERNRRELAELYRTSFRSFAELTEAGAVVVFIFPMLPGDKNSLATELVPQISGLGFEPEPLVPARFAHTPGFEPSAAGGVIYSRPDQKVRREIVRFRRQ